MQHKTQNLLILITRKALPLFAVLIVLLLANDVLACPTCKDGLAENDPASAAQAAGYFYSILFMMAMPFLILGTLGSAAYLSIRKAKLQRAESSTTNGAVLAGSHSST